MFQRVIDVPCPVVSSGHVVLKAVRRWPVAVCVPVRDEAVLLPRFLNALAAQLAAQHGVLCMVFDGCSDDSQAIVAAWGAATGVAVVTASHALGQPNAGRARRQAMALGMDVIAGDAAAIISTDADSVPRPGWLAANLAGLAMADVVAGRIIREAGQASPLQDRVEAYYDALFALRRTIDPVPWEAPDPHHYTSGASLAFGAGAYRALGGFEALPSAEDARLVDAAHRAGLRVRHDGAVCVETSARRAGRAGGGLAEHLQRLDTDGDAAAVTMAHPADVAWRYAGHAAARAAWADLDRQAGALATLIARPPADVLAIAADAPNAEAFAMRVVPDVPGGERTVTLDVAERGLVLLQNARRMAA